MATIRIETTITKDGEDRVGEISTKIDTEWTTETIKQRLPGFSPRTERMATAPHLHKLLAGRHTVLVTSAGVISRKDYAFTLQVMA